jgi:hypothetical protein
VIGTFSNVTVSAPNDACQQLGGRFEATTLSVVISVDSSECHSKRLSTVALAGIVVGAVVGMAVLILFALVIYRRLQPDSELFQYKALDDSIR